MELLYTARMTSIVLDVTIVGWEFLLRMRTKVAVTTIMVIQWHIQTVAENGRIILKYGDKGLDLSVINFG